MAMPADADLLAIWERARGEDPVSRALTLLGAARPGPRDDLAALSIGARDAALLDLYGAAFGEHVEQVVACPACGEPVELAFAPADLRVAVPEPAPDPVVEAGAWRVAFRLPDSRDLLAVRAARDVATGRAWLLARCVVEATCEGVAATAGDLPEDVVAAVARRMAECDPQAEVLLRLRCPACEAMWDHPFDVVPLVWAEVDRRARALLWQVHALASAYHWPEPAILAMSPQRRASYLELIGA